MSNIIDKIGQIESLKNGKDIQYLLNEAYKIFGNPLLMHDMEYNLIAYTENIITDDPIWNEFITTSKVSFDRLEFCKNECFFDTAANAKKITFLTSDKLKYLRILGKLFNKKNIQIGFVTMVACNKPFKDDDIELIGDVCDILSKEIGKNDFYNNYGQTYMETLVGELIEGISDKELYTAHVESIYMHLKANLYLAAVDIAECDPEYNKPSQFRDLFSKTQPEFKYIIYFNYILIIISIDDTILDVIKDMKELYQLFNKHNIYAGISNCFENLFELRKYYIEAVDALNYGLKSGGAQRIFQYDQIRLNPIKQ